MMGQSDTSGCTCKFSARPCPSCRSLTGRSETSGRYEYSATILLKIKADGLDIAWRRAKQAAQSAAEAKGVEYAFAPMTELRYEAPNRGLSGGSDA